MGRPLKRWPDYALSSAENTLALLKTIQATTREVQVAIQQRETETALILLGDVRVYSLQANDYIVRALSGNYKKEEADKWTSDKVQRVEIAA